MAEAKRDKEAMSSCGYCLVRLIDMVDPRELPCGDTFCKPCLDEAFRVGSVTREPGFGSLKIECPKCRSVLHVLYIAVQVRPSLK